MRHLRALGPSVLQCLPAGTKLILVSGNLSGALVHGSLLMFLVVNRHTLKVVDVVHHKAPFGSHDHASAVRDTQHGSRQCRHPAIPINQRNVVLLIQVLSRIGAGGFHAQKVRSEEHRRKIQRINAKIQEAPARQLRLHHPGLSLHVVAKVGRNLHRCADHAFCQLIPHHLHKRHVPRPNRLCNEDILLPGKVKKLPCLRLIHRKRLFHKAWLSVLDAGPCIGIMLGMRRSHID